MILRKSDLFLITVLFLTSLTVTAPAQSQTAQVIAYNPNSSSDSTALIYGQSFTTASTSPYYNTVTFSFQKQDRSNAGVANSNIYLFSTQYGGTPQNLSSAGALGSAAYSNGSYSFSPYLTLAGNTRYYAYSDTAFVVATSRNDVYSGGVLYYSSQGSSGYTAYPMQDARFSVSAIAATTPEPATWSLMIIGFGVTGGALRQKRNKGQPRSAAIVA